jgi:hypothetical protein
MTIKSKEELIIDINNEIVSNNTRKLTPEDIRRNLINIIESIHVIPSEENIVSNNLSTQEIRNTKVGIEALDSNLLSGQDNTAVGFHSSYSIYTGDYNTSLGSYSLGCNIYGDENLALGYRSLEANTQGNKNVAIGPYALKSNKFGNNNIAIGAYAGYYIDENDSYKFYVGSHNINSDYVCEHTDGSGLTPLMYGDLLNNVLGINVNTLNYDGQLQVNGTIVPSTKLSENSNPGNLGSLNYPWKKLFISEIWNSGNIVLNTSIIPAPLSTINIGASGNPLTSLHTNSLYVEGTANINSLYYNSVVNSQYVNKNLYLASSGTSPLYGTALPYLTDEGIDGGGLIIQSSGVTYQRNYSILYRQPNLDYNFASTAYEKSSWESNISFVILDDRFLQTNRIISPTSLNLFKADASGVGITIDNQIAIGTSGDRNLYYTWANGGDFNHVFTNDRYSSNIFGAGSGISIDQNVYSRYNGSLSSIYGFKNSYEDNLSGISSRQTITGYSNSLITSTFVTLRDSGSFGFSNMSVGMTPVTNFNIYNSGNSVFRHSSTNSVSLQLSVRDNTLASGLDLTHNNFSNTSLFKLFDNNSQHNLLGFSINKVTSYKPFSLAATTGVVSYNTGYGTFVVKEASYPNRSLDLFFHDDQGREFNLIGVSGNIFNSEYVYIDNKRNTLVGNLPYNTKEQIYASGGYENTSIGYHSVSGVMTGSSNLAIGYKAGDFVGSGNNNILIGNKLSTQVLHDTFLLGKDSGNMLMYGHMGSEPFVGVETKLEVSKRDNVEKVEIVQLSNDTIIRKKRLEGSVGDPELALPINRIPGNEILGDKPTSSLFFDFEGTTSHRLLELNASGSLSSAYVFTNTKPYVTLKGDLNLYGDIRFIDGTRISSGSGLISSIQGGVGISVAAISGVNTVNLDISKISTSGSSITVNTNVITETSGVPKRTPISQLSQFVNTTNPQTFYPCSGGYNLVLSNNTAVYHNKNCNTIFAGEEAGDTAEGFTNSIVIGTQAGQEAYFNNTYDLSVDIASIFVGYGAGRKSKNADNSIFIGQSAGQHSEGCDNSIFLGNSAGEFSRSEKSIGIGDNTLENVVGENNLEIVPNKENFNRIIGGTVSNKMNIGGIVAGDMCAGRVSVGGASRVFPSASLEVSANIEDPAVPLLKLFNCSGALVAYIDQEGNLRLKGNVLTGQTFTEFNNTPGITPSGLACGNGNYNGNLPDDGDLDPGGGDPGDGGSSPSGVAPSGYMLGYTSLFHEI